MSIKVTLRGAIESLQYERHRLSEALAGYPYGEVAPRIDALTAIIAQLVIVECELEDAMVLHEQPPAQPHGELRSVPPATEEESGGKLAAFKDKFKGFIQSDEGMDQIEASTQELSERSMTDAPAVATFPGGVKESRDQPCTCHPDDAPLECMKRYAASECQAAYGAKYFPPPPAEDFTLLDRAVLRDEPDGVEAEPEGYAPVVDAEPVLDATELAQVTIDKVPPTAEVIKDQTGRAKFALFGGQTHEVVEPSNTEADFWARALFPKKKEQA